MRFKIGQLRLAKKDVVDFIRKEGIEQLSFYCACSMFPLPAAITFCLEEFPEHKEELERKMKVIMEFYGYTAVEE